MLAEQLVLMSRKDLRMHSQVRKSRKDHPKLERAGWKPRKDLRLLQELARWSQTALNRCLKLAGEFDRINHLKLAVEPVDRKDHQMQPVAADSRMRTIRTWETIN